MPLLTALIARRFAAPALLALAAAAAAGWSAWHLGRAPLREENADLREAHAETTRLAALAAAARLQAAQQRSDALASDLLTTLATNAQLTEEKTHALQTATAGRACLSDRALRVLHGAPGVTVAGAGMPAPQPGTAAAGAAPAAPADPASPAGTGAGRPAHAPAELAATDTDVALWIATAGQQHEACRSRLNALIAWHTQPTLTQEPPLPQQHREPAP